MARWLQVERWDALIGSGDLQTTSPFLYTVCLLHGGRLSKSSIDSSTLEVLYEAARSMMGETLLASPLPLASIHGLVFMSIWGTAPKVSKTVVAELVNPNR